MTRGLASPRYGVARLSRRLLQGVRAYVVRHRRLAALLEAAVARVPRARGLMSRIALGNRQQRYEEWIALYDIPNESTIRAKVGSPQHTDGHLLFSLVVPAGDASPATLAPLVETISAQVLDRWELLFVGAPEAEQDLPFAQRAHAADSRIRPAVAVGTWVDVLDSLHGEFVVLVDPGVHVRPHALLAYAHVVASEPRVDVIYADEDTIDASGTRSDHNFRPAWNRSLLECQNYLGGFVCVRRSVAAKLETAPDEIEGSWGWSLLLALAAEVAPESVRHVPLVLHHRRSDASVAPVSATRLGAARALEAYFSRTGRTAEVQIVGTRSYRPRFVASPTQPSVCVVVPSTCDPGILEPCIDGLLRRTSYANLEIVVMANGPKLDAPARQRYVDRLRAQRNLRVLVDEAPAYNFSRLNNAAARETQSELICFLNDDTDPIDADWLAAMVARVEGDGVAAVGAMLYLPDDTIQHAGVILGVGGVAAHAYAGSARGSRGYHERPLLDQDVSCVTAACMLVRRRVFLDVGGFDEALGVAYNDVDLCLRLREAGWRIVWTPAAELYHRESSSLGRHTVGSLEREWVASRALIESRWSKELLDDPAYNPNLSLDRLEFWEPAFPPRAAVGELARC